MPQWFTHPKMVTHPSTNQSNINYFVHQTDIVYRCATWPSKTIEPILIIKMVVEIVACLLLCVHTCLHVYAYYKFLLFYTVLMPQSSADLERLVGVEILPEFDPRLSADVPSMSIYYGINEAIKTALQQWAPDSEKAVGSVKYGKKAREDRVLQGQEDAAKPRLHEKSHIKSSPLKKLTTQLVFSSSKQTVSSKQRVPVEDTGSMSFAAEPANDNLQLAAATTRERPKTGSGSAECESKKSVSKTSVSRKRKRKESEELPDDKNRFPLTNCLWNDELSFPQHLSQLSFFAELNRNPDDPMLMMSLIELDDITALQRQDFISDLNGAVIGRKPHFTSVHSPCSDRTFNGLGQLSMLTYCDGHFIECCPVSVVHMGSLHQWTSREPLQKIVHNILSSCQNTAVRLPYPSVRCVSDVMCLWLSDQLCYSMSEMGIECTDPPDIFVGASLRTELTANCLYQMFCRYVDFLCEKSEKYFRDADTGKVAAHSRGMETNTCTNGAVTPDAYHGKHAKLLKQILLSKRTKGGRKVTKRSSSRQVNDDFNYEDMTLELNNFRSLEYADVKQVMPLHEMARFDDGIFNEAAGYGRRKNNASAVCRKRRLPRDHFEDPEHLTSHDVPLKARRDHRGHTRLFARETESYSAVHEKKRDRQRTRQRGLGAAKSVSHDILPPPTPEGSPDFMLYDEDGNIVVQCSDTGHTMVVDEAKSGGALSEDEDVEPVTLLDELYVSNSPLYAVVHDHSYTSLPQYALEAVALDESDLGKDTSNIETNDAVSPLQLTDAAQASGAKDHKLADGRKSQLSVDPAVEGIAMRIHPLSSLAMRDTDLVLEVSAKESPKQSVTKETVCCMKMQKVKDSVVSAGKKAVKNEHSEINKSKMSETAKVLHKKDSASVMVAKGNRCINKPVTKEPVCRKKMLKVKKDSVVGAHKNADAEHKCSEVKCSEISKSKTSQTASVSAANLLTVTKPFSVGHILKTVIPRNCAPANLPAVANKPFTISHLLKNLHTSCAVANNRNSDQIEFSAQSDTDKVSNDGSEMSREEGENTEKVSDAVAEVSADIVEKEKIPVDTKISESQSMSIDINYNKILADDEVSVKNDKTITKPLLSPTELAAAARSASHYEDGYLSEMVDAYGVLPLSNFDVAFDPTNVPKGHTYNPFRKTWPILQYVVDGKSDLLLNVHSFPDVSSFSIRRVMRENGFLWAVCLALFDPKPDSTDDGLYSGLNSAANKGKVAKPSNPLMQAFRQAVEAKKKVATKSKLTMVRHKSGDDETQAWSARQLPAGKIVFSSGLKSGSGVSVSSVVEADELPKKANQLSDMLTSAINQMNSDINGMISQKCGRQCLDQAADITDYQSSFAVLPKHLSMLSEVSLGIYDIAECEIQKIFAAEDAAEMESSKNVKDSESVEVSVATTFAVTAVSIGTEATTTTAATATSATATTKGASLVSAPSLASGIALTSSTLPFVVNASKPLTTGTAAVSAFLSTDVTQASVAFKISQPFISQSLAAQSAATTAVTASVMTAVAAMPSTFSGAVTSGTAAVSNAAPVTVKVTATAVADMLPPPMPPLEPPPPIPPLALSNFGLGFDSYVGLATTSSALKVLPSSSVTQQSTNAAYQSIVGGISYPLSSVPTAFSNPSLPLEQFMPVPLPAVQPNMYPISRPVHTPSSVPSRAFMLTSHLSVPPVVSFSPAPKVASYPRTPRFPVSTSAAGKLAAPATVPVTSYKEMSQIPKTVVMCSSASANLLTVTGKLTEASSYPHTPWCPASISAAVSPVAPAKVPVSGYKEMSQTPKTVVTCTSVPANLFPVISKPFALGSILKNLQTSGAGVTSSSSATGDGQKPVPVVMSMTQLSASSPLPCQPDVLTNQRSPMTMAQLIQTSVSTAFTVSSVSGAHSCPESSLGLGQGMSQMDSVSATALQSVSSLLAQGKRPCGSLKPVIPVMQSPPGAALRQVSSPASTEIRSQSPHQNANVQLRGTVLGIMSPPVAGFPVVSQSNHTPLQPLMSSKSDVGSGSPLMHQGPPGGVGPGLLASESALLALSSTIRPISTQSDNSSGQSRANGPPGEVQPRPPMMNLSGQASARPTAAVCAASPLPSTIGPARLAGAVVQRPLTTAGVPGIVQAGKGPTLTPNCRVYVFNSALSPVCKDVEVSL